MKFGNNVKEESKTNKNTEKGGGKANKGGKSENSEAHFVATILISLSRIIMNT